MCLGTREIEIRTKKTQEKAPALLMVCCSCADSTSTDERTVTVSNGIVTYSCDRIDPVKDSKLDTVDTFTSHLLEKDLAGVSVVCDYEKEEEEIKVVIRQRLETGIVKLVWSGILTKDDNSNGCLQILRILGSTIAKQHKEQETSQKQQSQMQTDLQGWKDTATKLEGAWQSEKNVLLEQFHTLYKVTHEELRCTKLALRQLENRQKAAGNDYTSAHTNKKRSNLLNLNRVDHHHHQPDDQDELIYDMATVERLAAGPKQSTAASAAVLAIMVRRKAAASSPSRPAVPPRAQAPGAPKPPAAPNILSVVASLTSVDLVKHSKTATTASSTATKSAVGAVAVASVKDLFKDPVLKTKRKRSVDNDVDAHKSNPRRKQAEEVSLPKSSANRKKPKISASVDEKKRKELELLSALMDD
jgi:hypothetical protein